MEILPSNQEDVDDFLAHYGVKGMKWGQRKAEFQKNRATAKQVHEKRKAKQKEYNAGLKERKKTGKLTAQDRKVLIRRRQRRVIKSSAKLPVSKLTDSDKSGVIDVGLATWRALNG